MHLVEHLPDLLRLPERDREPLRFDAALPLRDLDPVGKHMFSLCRVVMGFAL